MVGYGVVGERIYEALTLMPDVRKDYSPSDFTRDVFLLDRSKPASHQVWRRALPALSHWDQGIEDPREWPGQVREAQFVANFFCCDVV